MLPDKTVQLIDGFAKQYDQEHRSENGFHQIHNRIAEQRRKWGSVGGITIHDVALIHAEIISGVEKKAETLWGKLKEIIPITVKEYSSTLAVDVIEILDDCMKPTVDGATNYIVKVAVHSFPSSDLALAKLKAEQVVSRLKPDVGLFCEKHLHAMSNKPASQSVQNNYFYGANNRAYQGSTDNSANAVNCDLLFRDMQKTVETQIKDEKQQEILLAKIEELKANQTKKSFIKKYAEFMSMTADSVTVFSPFIQALSQLALQQIQ